MSWVKLSTTRVPVFKSFSGSTLCCCAFSFSAYCWVSYTAYFGMCCAPRFDGSPPQKDGSRPPGKKPSWDINKNRIRDAEFRDLDG